MAEQIRFVDGDAYEHSMAVWSAIVGEVFLDWLTPASGLSWLDVGCGSGIFTDLINRRCAPSALSGVDPSAPQLAFARRRPGAEGVDFRQGDAMALPFPDDRFDAAVMALVIVFVPEPARGVSEMARVVRPGGTVSAYMWDVLGGGLPIVLMQQVMETMGLNPPRPPNPEASGLDAMQALWSGAGLVDVQARVIEVQHRYDNFEAFWEMMGQMPAASDVIARLGDAEIAAMKAELRRRLPVDARGGITHSAHANAVRGRVPQRG